MSRQLTPGSTLENLKREAKRWLKALRVDDADAHARLERAYPGAPDEPTLRHVQHALAREYGLARWSALKHAVAEIEARRGSDARQLAVTQLLQAAGRGDAARVNTLLDEHPDIVNELAVIPGHTGLRTALHHGVDHADVVACLLERGADPNIRDEGDNAMPLHFAAEKEDFEVIRMLIEHGADPIGADDWHGLEVIGWATCFGSGRKEIVDYLLAHGARHNIFSAVALGAVDEIRSIAKRSPAELHRTMDPANQGRRPLHLAVVKKRPESLAALLELGADTEGLDAAGLTALDQAALSGEAEMIRLLTAHGAEVRLPAAIASGDIPEIERLLREDPESLKPGKRWGTLIVRASERSSGDVIRALIRAGADVNVRDDTITSIDGVEGYTALHAAAWHGNAEVARILLEHRANPNVRDSRYCGTPAGWAAYANHPDVRDIILAARIDLFQAVDFDLPDRIAGLVQQSPWTRMKTFAEYANCGGNGNPEPWHTPLVWAVVSNKIDAVRALLEQGAAQILAPDGRTLIEIAQDLHHDEIASLLRQHRRVDATHAGRVRWFVKNACPDHDIRGPSDHVIAYHTAERFLRRYPEIAHDSFHTAIICGDLARVEHLLAERPELANENGGPKGWGPLLYLCFTRLPSVEAASENAIAIARLLLDRGADPNAYFMAGDSRYTPLVGVVGEGEEDRPPHPQRDALARLLLERGANPYDIQVLYNIHFHGRALWFLELIYEYTFKRGRRAEWQDPEWRMLDMGGYGTGARYVLEMAIRENNIALAEWALAHGASPNASPPRHPRFPKMSLYEGALRMGRTSIAAVLLRYGAAPGGVAMHPEEAWVAASLDQEDALPADKYPEYLRSPKAIMQAAEQDHAEYVAHLLDSGVPIEIENEHKQRPLHAAAWSDAVAVAELLIERGAEIDARETEYQNTPLDFAVYGQHRRMIELLSRYSRDIWNLVFVGKVERVREVLRERPELARIVADDWTPIMWLPDDELAAVEIIKLFLAYGANAETRSKEGLTAADYASRRGLEEAAALLQAPEQTGG